MKPLIWGEKEKVSEGPKAHEDKTPKLTVESIDNHVYFYAEVDEDRTLAMLKQIREIDTKLRNERLSRNLPDDIPATPIWLHIHSYGGYTLAGFGAADQLAQIPSPIYSIVEGCCASAATSISCACNKRFIMPSAFMLIHQFWSIAWGTYEEFKDDMKFQDMLIERLRSFYVARTKMDYDKVTELLKRDSWFDAKQCVKLGLVDEIWKP